ncbi:hypothetical protein GOP47_0002333 [Adiantum capillus-veneris]|uniref:Nodulin-like domain-containing protein n=1 Tax=Adiantum capillus-veneris TaxID=13818 RepID=A0A9D4V9Y0_ADICA|nr:hypothetical protein GOP47_0002333 [Adiantum capillus-veneris]
MEKKPFNRQFIMQVLKGRWMVVVVCLYILAFAGGPYVFGIYSEAIKAELQYDEETIDTLSFFKDLGNNVGIVSGLLNEILPPWIVLGVGSCMNLFGFVMMWMAVTHRIARPPLWQMYLYMTVGSNSMSFFNTGVVVTCVKNFPESRGEVLGLVKGIIGLSTAILTQIYHALYAQNTEGMILLLGWLPSLVTFICMFVVRPTKPVEDKKEGKHFFSFLYLALFLAAFLMLIIIVENQVRLTSISYKIIGVIILLLVGLNVVIAIRAERGSDACEEENEKELKDQGFKTCSKKQAVVHNDETSLQSSIQPPMKSGQGGRESVEEKEAMTPAEESKGEGEPASIAKSNGNPSFSISAYKLEDPNEDSKWIRTVKHFYKSWPQRGEDFSIPHAMLSLDMWIVFVVATCGIGATLTAIDNVGQIGASLGYSAVSISTCVSLISIWNFLGRVGSGYISEMLLRRYRFPRTLLLMVVVGLSCAGHLILAFPMRGALYTASVIEGLSFGAQWPILFAVISELFGLKHYATLYNVAPLAAPLGSYLLKVRVAGFLYDREAAVQAEAAAGGKAVALQHWMVSGRVGGGSKREVVCVGPSCFRLTFLIMTLVSALGTIIAGWLVLRTRKFYRQPTSSSAPITSSSDDKAKEFV